MMAHSLSPSLEKRRKTAVAIINSSSLPIEGRVNRSVLNRPESIAPMPLVGVAEAIAVSQVEKLTLDVDGHRLIVHDDATLLGEVSFAPYVVVADEEVHFDTHVGELRHLTQKAGISLRHHMVVFEPKVEDVAQHIHGRGLVLDAIEELHQATLACAHRSECATAQVCVRYEINHVVQF